MRIGAIIQARMGSRRFPGKVLHRVNGKPMLLYLIERISRCSDMDAIIVATSVEENDDEILAFCNNHHIFCHRGSLINVAERFINIIDSYSFDALVRISGDSPLLDQRLVSKGIELFRKGYFDMVTNVFPRSYPKGQSVEIVRSKVFHAAYPFFNDHEEREHVTTYFYKNQKKFNIFNFQSEEDRGHIQLSVDTPDDMKVFEKIIRQMGKPHWEYDLDDIINLYSGTSPTKEK